ncbi:hypothetical protein [Metarhizobium album]|uniref:hypothetical protein n=1 Tax=Metarhizobium album TaxID=2182425 RepID=UPI001FE11A75|nr:hypothetical protein [Rhizobium album]
MMAELAAGYCGEKTVEDFLSRVGTTYPSPRIVENSRRKFWYRDDLDRAMGIAEAFQQPEGMGERFVRKIAERKAEREAQQAAAADRRKTIAGAKAARSVARNAGRRAKSAEE